MQQADLDQRLEQYMKAKRAAEGRRQAWEGVKALLALVFWVLMIPGSVLYTSGAWAYVTLTAWPWFVGPITGLVAPTMAQAVCLSVIAVMLKYYLTSIQVKKKDKPDADRTPLEVEMERQNRNGQLFTMVFLPWAILGVFWLMHWFWGVPERYTFGG